MGKPLLANNYQHLLEVASICTPCCMLPVVGSCCAKFETGQTFRRPFAQSLKENLELMLVVTSSVIFFDPLRGGHF